MISKAQISRWIKAFQAHGMDGLIDNRDGRKRKEYGWELRAMNIYARPQKPSVQFVVDKLKREGFKDATYTRVRNYLNSLPTNLTTHSTGRLGVQKARATARRFVQRDTSVIDPGLIYQGDGHTVDVYVAHPMTGGIWRPELTVWMDVGSRYIPGWWISEAESAYSTLHALSFAMLNQNHVPAMLHIDNGSGYKSKLMADKSIGFYEKWGIETMFALPYNAKAKGQVERFFGTMERSFGKQWDSYCGHDMSAEVLNKLARDVKRDKVKLPSLEQYRFALEQWIEEYHHTLHRGLDGKTPAEVWATLERTPVDTPEAAAFMPRETRRVQRATLRLHNRSYGSAELLAYEGHDVIIEYNIHDDQWIRVLDTKEHWLCDAELVQKRAYIPESRVEELKEKRLKNQIARKERHIEEDRRRASLPIGHEKTVKDLDALDALKDKEKDDPEEPSLTLEFTLPEIIEDTLVLDLNNPVTMDRER